jgi:hypothetical protein
MAPAARDSSRFDTRRAKASRRSGEWTDDDYDVLADGALVGRMFKANASPVGGTTMPLGGFWLLQRAAV